MRSRRTSSAWRHRREARRGSPKTTQDYVSIMTAAKGLNPDSIYFGGVTATGGARILLAAQQVGLGDIPYVGPDGINDGSGATKDSFLNLAGDAAKNSYSTLAGIGDVPGQGRVRRRIPAEYGIAATGYAGRAMPAPRSSSTPSSGPRRRTRPTMPRCARPSASPAPTRSVTYTTILGDIDLRRERRHEPADRLDLLVRPGRRQRQGRLEVRDPGRRSPEVTVRHMERPGIHRVPGLSSYPSSR